MSVTVTHRQPSVIFTDEQAALILHVLARLVAVSTITSEDYRVLIGASRIIAMQWATHRLGVPS